MYSSHLKVKYICPILIMWLLIYLDKPKELELRHYIGFQEFWSVHHFLFLFSSEKKISLYSNSIVEVIVTFAVLLELMLSGKETMGESV